MQEEEDGRKERRNFTVIFSSPPFVLPSWRFLFRLKEKQKSDDDDRDFPLRKEEAAKKKFLIMLYSVYFFKEIYKTKSM